MTTGNWTTHGESADSGRIRVLLVLGGLLRFHWVLSVAQDCRLRHVKIRMAALNEDSTALLACLAATACQLFILSLTGMANIHEYDNPTTPPFIC
jgi:hypothetical protein